MAEKLTLAEGEEAPAKDPEDVEVVAAAAVEEEEEKQLTLEEYEVLMQEKRAGLNTQRDAAFKVDDAQFQGMKTFEKVEEDVGLSLTKPTKDATNKGSRERRERDVLIDVGFRVQSAEERAPSARGGRAGGRGGGDRRPRGRGGARTPGRGARSTGGRGASINVEDTSAFPSLG